MRVPAEEFRHDPFLFTDVEERIHVFLSGPGDLSAGVWVMDRPLDALLHVREIGADRDVVRPRDQLILEDPALDRERRAERDGVRGQDPFQVRCDVVALHREQEPVAQQFFHVHRRAEERLVLVLVGVLIRIDLGESDVEVRIGRVRVLAHEGFPGAFPVRDVVAESSAGVRPAPYQDVLFLVEWHVVPPDVVERHEMPDRVEVAQHGLTTIRQRPRFDERRDRESLDTIVRVEQVRRAVERRVLVQVPRHVVVVGLAVVREFSTAERIVAVFDHILFFDIVRGHTGGTIVQRTHVYPEARFKIHPPGFCLVAQKFKSFFFLSGIRNKDRWGKQKHYQHYYLICIEVCTIAFLGYFVHT